MTVWGTSLRGRSVDGRLIRHALSLSHTRKRGRGRGERSGEWRQCFGRVPFLARKSGVGFDTAPYHTLRHCERQRSNPAGESVFGLPVRASAILRWCVRMQIPTPHILDCFAGARNDGGGFPLEGRHNLRHAGPRPGIQWPGDSLASYNPAKILRSHRIPARRPG